MPDQSSRRPGRFSKPSRRRGPPRGHHGGGPDAANGNRRRDVNGNRMRNGNQGEAAVCIKCGHPAPDGKLCAFHRILLNTFRKEMPDQDPRRFRF